MNNFKDAIDKIENLDDNIQSLKQLLGDKNVDILQSSYSASDFATLSENIVAALKYYDLIDIVSKTNDKEKLAMLYKTAAEKQKELVNNNFDKSGLEDLSKQIYDATYGFVDKNPELQKASQNWANISFEERKIFCKKVLENLSNKFGIPNIDLIYANRDKVFNSNGTGYPNAMFVADAPHSGILGSIGHEFTHILQYRGKTPAGFDASITAMKNYMLPGLIANSEFYNFVNKEIYEASIMEAEASFVDSRIKSMAIENRNIQIQKPNIKSNEII